MLTAVTAILVFFLVVIFHEFGHFIVAKLVDIKVHEFSIGMGPRLAKIKKGETEYSIRILPIGGYVRMEGEDEASNDLRSFNNRPILSRAAVLFAGAFMNFVLAIIVFSIIAYVIGVPTTTINKVTPNFPAEISGLKSGDKIIQINDKPITKWEEIVSEINRGKNKELEITVLRENEKKKFIVKPVLDKQSNRLMIGIVPKSKKSVLYSIKIGIERTIFVIGMMFKFFQMLFQGNVSTKDVVGPVGIIYMVGEAARVGILNVLSLIGLISVNLGFFNLLPIPALDGSRLMFLLVEFIRKKPIEPEKEGFIHFIGFVFLMILMIIIAYKDIIRFNVFR
ncbi:RIP metalloprotease RseP [Caloranaerobacter azorensis]|uniref:Zinc metalloprotease n=2 Tax=Caloranaerobacter azorensis TaxID=116090 RepID=A0A1M5VE17_9FIRM|nr:RIP metalloprotease RseP [Caloranaerobacter azorensis]QIB26158.1 RIP metalloprotease RseP [Caloranaerobacter azorensis]SHH73512.1 regulator of sigma E protease [Caloranaerobacter azorensis DSM 13643]